MFVTRKNLMRGTAILAALFLCQCAKEGISADFDVTVVPERPLIHEVGRTINGNEEVEPEWFSFSLRFDNKTGYDIKIEDIIMTVQQEGDDPPLHTQDLGTLSDTCGDDSYDYINYCTYPNGYSGPWMACQFSATNVYDTGHYDCPKTDDTPEHTIYEVVEIAGAYVDGISIPEENQSASKTYTVHVEMQGIVMEGTTEKDRFTKRFIFTTR